jgi:anaerobic ribonucleoside-triphosphate reductase activating protein
MVELLQAFKAENPTKDIWVYTGYEYNRIKYLDLSKYVDVAVVGPFLLDQRDISDANRWRGSRNQRVLDMKASLKADEPVPLIGIPNNEID